MQAKKQTLMGALLNRIKGEREEVRRTIIKELWERNKLGNPRKRQGFKVEENTTVDVEGNSIISAKLWQLVDQKNVKISANITKKTLAKIKEEPEPEPETDVKLVQPAEEPDLESLMS